MAAGFSTFANRGVHNDPELIARIEQVDEDGDVTVLEEARPSNDRVLTTAGGRPGHLRLRQVVAGGTGPRRQLRQGRRPARPAPPATTATPGSSATRRSSPPRCGWATRTRPGHRRATWTTSTASRSPAARSPRRSGTSSCATPRRGWTPGSFRDAEVVPRAASSTPTWSSRPIRPRARRPPRSPATRSELHDVLGAVRLDEHDAPGRPDDRPAADRADHTTLPPCNAAAEPPRPAVPALRAARPEPLELLVGVVGAAGEAPALDLVDGRRPSSVSQASGVT